MSITLSALQQQRRDTAANWTSANPTLLAGEIGVETDTGLLKIGDGSTAWTSLDYLPLSFEGYAANGIYNPAANQVALATNGTGRLFIDSSGNVGIGTTPEEILHIKGPSEAVNTRDGVMLQHSTAASTADTGLPIVWSGYGSASLTNYTFASICGRKENGTDANYSGYLQFATGDSSGSVTEKARIDSSGRLLVGTPTSLDTNGKFQVNSDTGGIIHFYEGGNTTPVRLRLTKSRGDTTAAISGDGLGEISFRGRATSNNLRSAATIAAEVDATPGATFVPGRLVFSTTASGSSSPSPRMYINSSGNVGIGTGSPGSLNANANNLVVGSGSGSEGMTIYTGNTNLGAIYFADGTSGNEQYRGWFEYSHSSDALTIGVAAGERLKIDSSGRLLVGTSSARTDLVRPHLNIEGAGDAGMTIIRNTNNPSAPQLEFGKSRGTVVGASTSVSSGDQLGMIRFRGADGTDLATEAVRITAEVDGTPGTNDMPGRLVFSTTADGASSPTERMRIASDGYVYLGGHVSTDVVGFRPGNAGQFIAMANSGGFYHQVGSNYYLVKTEGGDTSDLTLKTNIQPITESLEKVSQIRGVTFEFIEESLCTSHQGQQIGVIAQEVETVFPEAVVTAEDGIKAVRYDKLVAPLIEALKEAKERIETLESKVAALEAAS